MSDGGSNSPHQHSNPSFVSDGPIPSTSTRRPMKTAPALSGSSSGKGCQTTNSVAFVALPRVYFVASAARFRHVPRGVSTRHSATCKTVKKMGAVSKMHAFAIPLRNKAEACSVHCSDNVAKKGEEVGIFCWGESPLSLAGQRGLATRAFEEVAIAVHGLPSANQPAPACHGERVVLPDVFQPTGFRMPHSPSKTSF